MTAADLLARAHRAMHHGCIYKLGMGGIRENAYWPWNTRGECDCSGFAAWCLGVSRHTDHPWYKEQNGGWLETTAIARDCKTPFGIFEEVAWTDARPGHFLVWGDSQRGQGHIGIVSQVATDGPTHAIHCSSGNYRSGGDAIRETGVELFKQHGALVANCALVTDPWPEIPGRTPTPEP